jgi:hypothetical protein
VTVSTNSSTVIFNADGTVDASLATAESAGDNAVVTGSYDATSKILTATSIQLFGPGSSNATPGAGGIVSADNVSNGSISLQVAHSDNWLPTTTSLTVNVTSNTTFVDASGVDDTESEFFSALTTGTTRIFATGPISNGTMQATTIWIVGGGSGLGSGTTGGGGVAEVVFQGTASNADPTAGTFDLTIDAWEGLWSGAMSTIHVTTNSATAYRNNLTPSTFFSGLTPSTQVIVRGALDTSTETITAAAVSTGSVLQGGGGRISI